MPGLCAGAVVLVQSTLLPSQIEKLEQKLTGKILCISARLLACPRERTVVLRVLEATFKFYYTYQSRTF
jgi:hypothetical protein